MLKDRSDVIFLTAALALVAGVPVALYTIYYFAESIAFIATALLLLIVLVCVLGVAVALFKRRLISYIAKVPQELAHDLSDPLAQSISNYMEGDANQGADKLTTFFSTATAHLTWIQTRRWIVGAAAGLLLGFAGLVGSALLKQQNDLILEQNTFFQEQIDQQQQLLELQQTVANQNIRSEAILRIYGPDFVETPRVKAEAVRSLVAVERVRIALGNNTLPTEFINLHDADLSGAWLDSADLKNVSFRGSLLEGANFNSADLSGSVFRFTRINRATFMDTDLTGTNFMFSDGAGSVFARVKLAGSNFNQINLKNSALSADLSGAHFYRVNLENADLSGLSNWDSMSSIEGSNVYGVRNAPDGFMDWALRNGAIADEGALSDLWERSEAFKQLEETSR